MEWNPKLLILQSQPVWRGVGTMSKNEVCQPLGMPLKERKKEVKLIGTECNEFPPIIAVSGQTNERNRLSLLEIGQPYGSHSGKGGPRG